MSKFNQLCVWPGTVVGDSKKIQKDLFLINEAKGLELEELI